MITCFECLDIITTVPVKHREYDFCSNECMERYKIFWEKWVEIKKREMRNEM